MVRPAGRSREPRPSCRGGSRPRLAAAARLVADGRPPQVSRGVGSEQPATVGQEGGTRSRRRDLHGPDRPVASREPRRGPRSSSRSDRYSTQPASVPADIGARKYGRWNAEPRALDREPAGGVEAQEPDAGSPAATHVRPHVDLGERAQPGDRGQESRRDVLHPERHDPEPGAAAERVELEASRDERPKRLDRDRPVGEQQVEPTASASPTACHSSHGPPAASPRWSTASAAKPATKATSIARRPTRIALRRAGPTSPRSRAHHRRSAPRASPLPTLGPPPRSIATRSWRHCSSPMTGPAHPAA